jgi:putative ABC transport system permease protein
VVTPLQEIVGKMKSPLLILLGAVAFVLLSPAPTSRESPAGAGRGPAKEIALRLALGANRTRLTKQLLVESVLLSLVGGLVGLGLAYFGLNVLTRFIPQDVVQADTITIDARVLLFTLAAAVITGLIFGLAPATQASHFNLNETLKEGGRDSGAGVRGKRLRNSLVIAEVATLIHSPRWRGTVDQQFLSSEKSRPRFSRGPFTRAERRSPRGEISGYSAPDRVFRRSEEADANPTRCAVGRGRGKLTIHL